LPGFRLETINEIAGINIQIDNTEEIPHPAVVLDKIYKAGGRTSGYSKSEYVIKDIMVEGRTAALMALLELLIYTGICVYVYL
jgi:hypothetical protein